MLFHKDLLLAAKKIENPSDELKLAIEKSESFLQSSKSFEYAGAITLPHGSTIKLKDMSMDLDDVFKMLSNKKTDIKGTGAIYIIWEDEKKEVVAKSEPAADAIKNETVNVVTEPATPMALPDNLMLDCD